MPQNTWALRVRWWVKVMVRRVRQAADQHISEQTDMQTDGRGQSQTGEQAGSQTGIMLFLIESSEDMNPLIKHCRTGYEKWSSSPHSNVSTVSTERANDVFGFQWNHNYERVSIL